MAAPPADDSHIIWSAQFGGTVLTAWDSHNRIHSFDIDTHKILSKITDQRCTHDAVITAMVPALDTIWVGMGTGHIMVFHKEELLTWFQPYKGHVIFLSLTIGSGPLEQCIVVSGGKDFVPPVGELGPDYKKVDNHGKSLDNAGVVVVWEAFEAKTMRQVDREESWIP